MNLSLRNRLAKQTKEANSCNIENCVAKSKNLCFKKNVVYKMHCNKCNKFYIGSTIRHLHTRIQEHVKSDKNSSIFKHILQCQNQNDFEIHVIAQERDAVNLRIREGILIHERGPDINSKSELADFQDFLVNID